MENVTENEGLPPNKKVYNDKYRKILNKFITQTVHGIELNSRETLHSSQLGATFWSSEEKQCFFSALSRLGKHDIRGISIAVGTKSELEVRVYSLLLSQFLTYHYLHRSLHDLVRTPYLPAAFEIGRECETVLDDLADSLSKKQLDHEISMEKKKHSLGLLDFETANRLTENMANGEDATGNALELFKATDLLNLHSFLNLSEGIFLNSSRPEENWRSYVEGEETPSIFPTAFLDIYNLTLSVTKRLVQSTLHLAMSRFEALDKNRTNWTPSPTVRKQEVFAALNILGIKCNRKEYWAKVARRFKLHVSVETRTENERNARLRYSQVESILMESSASEEDASTSSDEDEILPAQPMSSHLPTVQSGNEEERHFSTSWSSSSESIQGDTHSIPARFTNPKRRLKALRHHEKAEDTYMQAYDLHNSHDEERRLWISLGRKPPEAIDPEIVELPRLPPAKRKYPEDLIDWRDHIQFQSPWERYDAPVLAKSFKQNKRVCRRARPTRTVETTATETELGDDNRLRDCDSNIEDEDVEDGGRHEQQVGEEEREEEEEATDTDVDVDVDMDVDLERKGKDEGSDEEDSEHEDGDETEEEDSECDDEEDSDEEEEQKALTAPTTTSKPT
ncbi:hypothetical protein MMC14_008177 [Varicellaria rhodocarpa]|nr:hypothetical protein [Varicellaria rhodocarpa]